MPVAIVPGTVTNAIAPVDPHVITLGDLGELAGITSAILAAPFILWSVWNLVSRNLRAWRVRRATPGLHYIGTWYGGVDAKKHAENVQTRQIRKANFRSDRSSADSTAEYSRIFWDPSREQRGTHAQGGRKSILRFLPPWMRNDDDGSAFNTTTSLNSLSIAEAGLSFTGYQRWPRARRAQDVNAQLTAGPCSYRLPISRDTSVTFPPKGTSAHGICRPWRIPIHETTSADKSQYLIPQNVKERLDIPAELIASALTCKNPHMPRASTITNAIANQTYSPPVILSSSKRGRVKRWFSEPYELESSSGNFVAAPKLYPARNPEGPSTPHNSDEFFGSGSATPQVWRSRNSSEQVEFSARENFVQNLCERLMFWARPLVLNPYKSTGSEFGGIDGRPSSPTMGWLVGRESAIISSTNFDRESSKETFIRENASPGCSTCSSISLDRAPVCVAQNWASDRKQPLLRADPADCLKTWRSYQPLRHNAGGSCSSDSAFQGSYLPGKMRLISSFLPSKWSSLPTRRVQVLVSDMCETRTTSPIEESRLDQISDDWTVEDYFKVGNEVTRPTFGESASSNTSGHPLLRKPAVGPAVTPVPNPHWRYKVMNSRLPDSHRHRKVGLRPSALQSTPEEGFLADLDRRLNRLDYELSPGFRGARSRESTCRSRWESVPCHFHVLDGMSQPNMRPDQPRRSLHLPPATRICDLTDLTDMQHKKTKSHNNKSSLKNPPTLIRSEIFPRADPATATATIPGGKYSEPREGAIDSANWILRRPPMGARPSHTAEQALLYSNGRSTNPKPLAAWQAAA